MADRYWVGGTASWDGTAGTKWAATSGGPGGESVPTSADDVFFNASSTGTVTIAAGNTGAKSITCTGFTGTLTGVASITVSGNITLVTGMTYSHTGTVTINATSTLTTAGKLFSSLIVEGSGITVTLGGALNTSTRTVTVLQGTLTTSASNYSITASQLISTGAGTRTISLNGSTVTLSSGSPSFPAINFSGSNLTLNAGTSTIDCTNSSSATFNGNGLTFNTVNFTGSSVSSDPGIVLTGANTFSTLTFTAPATTGVTIISTDSDFTATTLVCSGASVLRRMRLISSVVGTRRTITNTTWTTISDVDFVDIGISRAISGTRLGDGKNNNNITFDAPKTVYWNLAGTQNWSATGWALTSGGTPAVNNFPLAQDTAIIDDSSAGTSLTINVNCLVGTVDMSARAANMTFAFGNTCRVMGNWISSTSAVVTYSNTAALYFSGRTTQTLTSAGRTFTTSIVVENPNGSVVLQDAYTSNLNGGATINVLAGTFDSNGFNVTLSGTNSGFISSNSSTRTIAVGSGTWTIAGLNGWNTSTSTNLTVTGTGTVSLTSSNAKSFQGGSISYSGITVNQGGSGALSITGDNTFANITNTYNATGAATIRFGGNQTVSNFTATGVSGRVLTINSTSSGTQRTLTKTGGGIISVNFLSISDSNATGIGATWYAGANSTNVSNNTGWIFSGVPSPSGFLMFFN